MGRIRTVKPQLFLNSDLYDAEVKTGLPIRFAWIGLLTVADREGRFKWKPREMKPVVLPYDECDFSAVLDALVDLGVIARYTVDGNEYGHIVNWVKHQHVNAREASSELPPPVTCMHVHARGERKGKEGESDASTGTEISPEMVAKAVMEDLGLSGSEVARNLGEVFKSHLRTASADDTRATAVRAWTRYRQAVGDGKLAFTLSPAKFFGNGAWLDEAMWGWKDGARTTATKAPVSALSKLAS